MTDEFSYLLGADTLANGRLSNESPILAGAFEAPHVLVRPRYASKYFPGQAMVLAIGQIVLGAPIVGVWLSGVAATVAVYWMLVVWIDSRWALVGSFLFSVHIGVLTYWTQSYWGGAFAACGGSIFCGAVKQLWDAPKTASWLLLATGAAVLALSRPIESVLMAVALLAALHLSRRRPSGGDRRRLSALGPTLAAGMALAALGGMLFYNKNVTGSAFLPPYLLHEIQYQQYPQLVGMVERSRIQYSSAALERYYIREEGKLYQAQQDWRNAIPQIVELWAFYLGPILTAPFVIVILASGRGQRIVQALLSVGWAATPWIYNLQVPVLTVILLIVAVIQFVIVLRVFSEPWERVAVCVVGLMVCEIGLVKWAWPHYLAPAAGLVMFLVTSAMRMGWKSFQGQGPLARVRAVAGGADIVWSGLGGVVTVAVPFAILLSLGGEFAARVQGYGGATATDMILTQDDWSRLRAGILSRLEASRERHLIFVAYSATHDPNEEWVYNQADLAGTSVLWARDLGDLQNNAVAAAYPGRILWSLMPDVGSVELTPYDRARSQR